MCFRVGELLFEAKQLDPVGWRSWVETRLPFSYSRAQRLVAIHLAYRELPVEMRAQLPRPWQALYALHTFTGGTLEAAIQRGEIGPATTARSAQAIARRWKRHEAPEVKARFTAADLIAGKLLNRHPDELNPVVRERLTRWLRQS